MPTATTLLSAALAATSAPPATAPSAKPRKGSTSGAAWLHVAALPPVRTASGEPAPLGDVQSLLRAMESGADAGGRDAALAAFAEAKDQADLDAFALELTYAWVRARGPVDGTWILPASARLGGPPVTRALALLARRFARERAVPAALLLVDAMGERDADDALVELKKLEHAPKEIAARAETHVERILRARGLEHDDVEDLVVPDCALGVGEELDFGARTFRVDFDAEFNPVVRDGAGSRLANLPRAGKKDDAVKAAAAIERWKDLRTTLRDTLRTECSRFEWSMCAERRWTRERFAAAILGHPLLRRLAQRVLWACSPREGAPAAGISCFRVAEDGTLADETDNPVELPSEATVLIPHTLHIPEGLRAAWGTVFADYTILPPFPQLGRETFTPEDAERDSTVLERFRGVAFTDKARFVLESYGWIDHGEFESECFVRTFPDGTEATVYIHFHDSIDDARTLHVEASQRLGDMSPLSFSELCRDIARVPRRH